MAVELNGKVWKKFVEFFRHEKGYEDWTEDEIEDSRNDDDTTEFIGWLVNELEANKYAEEDLECALEDLAWWAKEQFDETPLIFRNDLIQEKFYKLVEEYRNE